MLKDHLHWVREKNYHKNYILLCKINFLTIIHKSRQNFILQTLVYQENFEVVLEHLVENNHGIEKI